jgi:hypothetical protein
MSALCQKQTKCSAAILGLLLDHLVGERQKKFTGSSIPVAFAV